MRRWCRRDHGQGPHRGRAGRSDRRRLVARPGWRSAGFIWQHGPAEADYLYGFPLLPGKAGVKAASERYDGHVDPDQVDRTVSAAEAQAIYSRHIAGRLRGVSNRLVRAATCLYTVTPDAGFIVDRLREDGAIIAASACSGHGFKHSPAMGERLAAMAMDADSSAEPSFALSRFA